MSELLNVDPTEFDPPAPTFSSVLEEVPQLEPGIGDPPVPTNNARVDLLSESLNSATQEFNSNPKSLFETTYYNPDVKERYKGTASLYNEYFDPKADNERVAYENWDKWDAISAGLGMFKDNFVSAYAESAYTWPRAAKALFTLDADYLSPSQEEAERMNLELEKNRIENPIFYAQGTEDDFLTKGFMAETLGNLGFTFGTLGELATEFAVTTAISGALASTGAGAAPAAAAETAMLARAGTKIRGIWKGLTDLFVGAAVDDVTKAANATLDFAQTSGANAAGQTTLNSLKSVNAVQNAALNGPRMGINLWDNALKVASKLPIAGEIADAARISKMARSAGLTSQELMKIGAGGLRRSFAEWQMAAGEASIEAGHNYGEALNRLKAEYEQKTGQKPYGYDLENLKNLAMQSSTADFATNAAVLAITNKIQWGNILGKFRIDSAALAKIRANIGAGALEDLGILGVRNATTTKLYQKGLLGTLGLAPQIATDFGKKQAAWEVGKSMLKGLTRIEISEGLQENIQEGASSFLIDYYADIYKQGFGDWDSSFSKAVDEQLTKRGAKTFLMGALTGVFVRPVMSTISYGMDKINKESMAHKESVKQSIEILNKFYDRKTDAANGVLNEAFKEMKLQTQFNDGMIEGLLTKDKYQYFNNQESALIRTALHAKRTGTMDYLVAFINGYGNNFSDKEFKEAFGYTPQELGKSSAAEALQDISSSVRRFSDIYEKYQNKYGMFLKMEDLIQDPAAKAKFGIRRAALMDAITTAAFIESKSQESIRRSKSIMQNIAQYESIGNSLSAAFNTLVSGSKMEDMINILNNEIKILQEGEQTPQSQSILGQKTREKQLLDLLKEELFESTPIEDPNSPGRIIKILDVKPKTNVANNYALVSQLMTEYLTLKNQQNGITTPVYQEEIQEALGDIYDYMALGQDHAEYVEAVNLLNDPDKFTTYHQNLMNARAGAQARLLYDQYMQLGEISEVARKWLDDNKNITDEILAFSKQPSLTFDSYQRLEKLRNDLFEKRFELFTDFIKANTEPEQPKAEEKVTDVQEQKVETLNNNTRVPIDIIKLFNEGQTDLAQEYMEMRYSMDDITSFPFGSSDRQERVIKRYYKDENGQRIVLNGVPIPVEFQFDASKPAVPIDTPQLLYEYLILFEDAVYKDHVQKQESTPQESDSKVENLDTEKAKLQNHVDQPIIYDGKRGTLSVEGGNFIAKLEDQSIILGPVTEEASFDDFAELSIDYNRQTPENKEVLAAPTAVVVDTQESGTVTMSMDNKLETVIINGIEWTIEKNEQGLATAFVRTYKRKKGKREKVFVDRLSANNPKGKEYAARVNAMLALTMAPVPNSVTTASVESEVLDQAIEEAYNQINKESDRRKKSDELLAEYRLNQLINKDATPEIIELRSKFDNPQTRSQLSNDDLVKLFIWADDLTKRIKKEWSVYLTNPVVNNFLNQLLKEYINPITEITDGGKRPAATKPTKRGASQKKRAEKLTESVESRKGKRAAAKVQAEPTGKAGKRTVSKASKQVENKAEKKKKVKIEVSASTPDKKQKLPLGTGSRMIKNLANRKVQSITQAIASAPATPTVDINPFSTLNSKTSCEI